MTTERIILKWLGLFFFAFRATSSTPYPEVLKASHSVCFKRQDTNNSNLKYMHAFMISCRRIRRSRPCPPPTPPHGFLFHAAGFPCFQFRMEKKKKKKKYVVCLYFRPWKIEKGTPCYCRYVPTSIVFSWSRFEKKKRKKEEEKNKKVRQNHQDSCASVIRWCLRLPKGIY